MRSPAGRKLCLFCVCCTIAASTAHAQRFAMQEVRVERVAVESRFESDARASPVPVAARFAAKAAIGGANCGPVGDGIFRDGFESP